MADLALILGSKTDLTALEPARRILDELKIKYILEIISAHRNPDKARSFAKKAKQKGIKIIIACAGKAAALPGFLASYTELPVIGVALEGKTLAGIDALFSIVGVPKGIGLSSTGIGSSAAINAVIFALKILALSDKKYRQYLAAIKKKFS